jgi:hypothetical protein
MEFEIPWTTATPDGDEVEVQVWGDRTRGDAEVRILNGLILGAIGDVRQADPPLTPAPDAVLRYGPEWVENQLSSGRRIFAFRLPRR